MNLQKAFTEKVQKGIFNPIARVISFNIEDRLADAIGQTWAFYRRKADEGHLVDDALLVHHCKLRAIDLGRSVVPAGGWKCRDVMDPRAHRSGKVEVVELEDGYAVEDGLSPGNKLNSAIDLESWLTNLNERDQAIIGCKLKGMNTSETARELGISITGAYQRERKLGRDLATRAGIPLHEKPKQVRRKAA